MNKKILFIASLKTKKQRFDGERVKSSYMYESLSKKFNLTTINLSTFKLFNTFRIILNAVFCKRKFHKVVISKDPHGANIIIKIFHFFHFPLEKIIYFEIGPFLYDRILNKSIKKETFKDILIVVETKSMMEELESLGFCYLDVFPNFKPVFEIESVIKSPKLEVLKLVYFSRIDEMKGIYDLLESVEDLNKNQVHFILDIYGKISINFDEKRFKYFVDKYDFIRYKGVMDLKSKKDYEILSSFDLHVFPTKYSEGFPGSLIDFFIAGVPTLSSKFARAKDILSDNDSFFFDASNKNDLKNQLQYIYDHQELLIKKRRACLDMKNNFSIEKFENYCENILN